MGEEGAKRIVMKTESYGSRRRRGRLKVRRARDAERSGGQDTRRRAPNRLNV